MSMDKGKEKVDVAPEDMDVDAAPPGANARDIKMLASHAPWVEKYRPTSLEQVASHGHIVSTRTLPPHARCMRRSGAVDARGRRTTPAPAARPSRLCHRSPVPSAPTRPVSHLIKEDKLPHLLFYGSPGTGKTSTILACARQLYGPHYQSMVLELNASDDRGIDVVRNRIKDFASTRKIFSSGVKLIILHEAYNMTGTAQAALRRVIEKYTKNARFCLICNYSGKIIPALQSRCTKFRFAPLRRDEIVGRLRDIIAKEKVDCDDAALEALIRLSGGDMRKCLNVLQSAHMAYDRVSEENVYACTGNPSPKEMEQVLHHLLNTDFATAYGYVSGLQIEKGLALLDILTELHESTIRTGFPPAVRIELLRQMGELEQRLATATNERIQLGSLVGMFQVARQGIAAAAAQ